MRLLLFVILSTLLCSIYACEDDEKDELMISTLRGVVENSNLVLLGDSLNTFIVSPASDTFMLIYSRAYNPLRYVIDDEVTYTLYLQLPNGTTSFNWSREELVARQVGIGTRCFCSWAFNFVTEGSISGERMANGNWQVTGSIVLPEGTPTDFPKDISGTYR